MKFFLLLLALLFFLPSSSQPTEETATRLAQQLSDFGGSPADPGDLVLMLTDWMRNPISLNDCSLGNLEAFFFLSPSQRQALLNHRNRYGPFISLFELQAVEEINLETAELLSWFVRIDETQMSDHMGLKQLLKRSKSELILQEARTKPNSIESARISQYAGSIDHLSVRYRAQSAGRLWYGFSLEKDPGEAWGMMGDFQSFHFMLNRKGLLQTIVIGDYQAGFGLGLNFSNTFFPGKSSAVFQTRPPISGFRPSRSLNEAGYFRGMAYTLGKGSWKFDQWLSLAPGSANLLADASETDRLLILSESGLHRTATEISRKNTVRTLVGGFHFQIKRKHHQVGILLNESKVVRNNLTLITSDSGFNHLQQKGLYIMGQISRVQYQAEFSTSGRGSHAGILNLLFPINGKTDVLLLGRIYDPTYKNPFSNAWAHYSSIGNEQGFYLGFQYRPNKNWLWLGYSDFFHSPMPRYLTAFPSSGKDHLMEIQHPFSRTHSMRLRGRYLEYQRNNSNEEILKRNAGEWRLQMRVDAFQEGQDLSNHFRTEYNLGSTASGKHAEGLLIFQDFRWKFGKNNQWSIRMRLVAYRSNDYLVRAYAPMPDFPPGSSLQQFSGSGNSWSFLVQHHLTKKSILGFRYGFGWEETENSDYQPPVMTSAWKLQYRLSW